MSEHKSLVLASDASQLDSLRLKLRDKFFTWELSFEFILGLGVLPSEKIAESVELGFEVLFGLLLVVVKFEDSDFLLHNCFPVANSVVGGVLGDVKSSTDVFNAVVERACTSSVVIDMFGETTIFHVHKSMPEH